MSPSNISGSPSATYLYRVDDAPLGQVMPSGISAFDSSQYWGVYFVGGNNPSANLSYEYTNSTVFGNSSACLVDLVKRSDGSDSTWSSQSASLSSTNVSITGQGRGEFTTSFFSNNRIYSKDSVNLCEGVNLVLNHNSSGLSYTWFKNGAQVSGAASNRLVASDSGTYYMVLSNGACRDTSNRVLLEFRDKPIVTYSGMNGGCSDLASDTLSVGIPSGGVYSGTYVSGPVFAPNQAGVGLHKVVYEYTDSTGCKDTVSFNYEVFALPQVNLSPVSPRCQNAASFSMTGGTPSGGSYFSQGNQITQFAPSAHPAGLNQVFYEYTDSNGCTGSASIHIRLHTLPVVQLSHDTSFCEGDGAFQLQGSPSGGIYSGTGVYLGGFYPDSAGVGSHVVTYTRTDSVNSRTNSIDDTSLVHALPAKPSITRNANVLFAPQSSSYYWYNASGMLRSNDSSFTPGSNGSYYLVVENDFGRLSPNSDTLEFIIQGNKEFSGIPELEWRNIEGGLSFVNLSDKVQNFQVFDLKGSLIRTCGLRPGEEQRVDLQVGVYILRLPGKSGKVLVPQGFDR
jgi:hypothetical protein